MGYMRNLKVVKVRSLRTGLTIFDYSRRPFDDRWGPRSQADSIPISLS